MCKSCVTLNDCNVYCNFKMIDSQFPRITLPESALAELEMVENSDWSDGVSLSGLIDWINHVVDMYRPDETDSRSSPNFTPRSFRHYQTLGCIDSPTRSGKNAVYGFRHYLQALLVRKLLWERMPSEQICSLLHGKTNEDYKKLLLQGIEIVARDRSDSTSPTVIGNRETWTRAVVGTGIELHIREDEVPRSQTDIREVLEAVERVLRKRR